MQWSWITILNWWCVFLFQGMCLYACIISHGTVIFKELLLLSLYSLCHVLRVREAAMTSLMEVTKLAASGAPEILSPDLWVINLRPQLAVRWPAGFQKCEVIQSQTCLFIGWRNLWYCVAIIPGPKLIQQGLLAFHSLSLWACELKSCPTPLVYWFSFTQSLDAVLDFHLISECLIPH